MKKAHIKRMFSGAVTSQGFYSLYHYMIEKNARHIFILKGGPGVGKSTFMKKISQTMLERGYDVEFHHCSSDNDSIDGVVFQELNIALLDGTAPHIVDPKTPGAVDEMINLGEYWDEEVIKKHKREIMACNEKISGYFQRAYFALQEAKTVLDEWKYYTKSYQDWSKVNQMTLGVEKELFQTIDPELRNGGERHLFAWGHTPQGKKEYIDTLIRDADTLYLLKGPVGSGKSTFLAKIAERALAYGLDVQFYHNTLDPRQLDLIVLPNLNKALVIDAEPYAYTPQFTEKIIVLDFAQSIDSVQLEENCGLDIEGCRIRIEQHITRALGNSKKAKAMHDLLETYYIPAMDFPLLEKKCQAVLAKILAYAEE